MRNINGSRGYSLSTEGECYSPSGIKLKLNTSGGYNKYSIVMEDGRRKHISLSKLMRETYPYEWINELEDGEEVKPLPNHRGYYITSYGRMWSEYWWRWNTPYLSKQPPYYYWRINYGRRGNTTSSDIHTLVGRNFLSEYREGLLILHKQETLSYPEINYVDNLYVGTYTDNNRDCVRKNRWRNGYMV